MVEEKLLDGIIVVSGPINQTMKQQIEDAHARRLKLPHGARYVAFDPNCRNISPADILADMATTYRERNTVYGDNWKNVGQVMMSLFPNGVHLGTAKAFNEWHLFELIVVKLTRFANSKLTHADSIHDIAVYAAMIEAAIKKKESAS